MGMTKTPDEIKKGLECRIRSYRDICDHKCDTCDLRIPAYTIYERYEDALALIQQKEQENAEQAERIRQLEAERDALMTFMEKECYYCKHNFSESPDCPCLDCVGESHFEWRGVQKEE